MADYDTRNLIELSQDQVWEYHPVDELYDANAQQANNYALDNIVHPIFRRDAFRDFAMPHCHGSLIEYTDPRYDVSKEFYTRLTPALQLATILLTRAAPFFVRVLRCPVHELYPDEPHFDMLWRPSAVDYEALDHELHSLTHMLHFFWIAEEEVINERVRDMGLTGARSNVDSYARPQDGYVPVLYHTGLNSPLLGQINRTSWLTKTDAQRATLLAETALILVHELAHVLWKRRFYLTRPPSCTEPMFWDEGYRELGAAVIRYLFGIDMSIGSFVHLTRQEVANGVTEPSLRAVMDGSAGLSGFRLASDGQSIRRAGYVISFQTVFAMFDRRTWTNNKPFRITYIAPADTDEYRGLLLLRMDAVWARERAREAGIARRYPQLIISPPPSPGTQASGPRRLHNRRL